MSVAYLLPCPSVRPSCFSRENHTHKPVLDFCVCVCVLCVCSVIDSVLFLRFELFNDWKKSTRNCFGVHLNWARLAVFVIVCVCFVEGWEHLSLQKKQTDNAPVQLRRLLLRSFVRVTQNRNGLTKNGAVILAGISSAARSHGGDIVTSYFEKKKTLSFYFSLLLLLLSPRLSRLFFLFFAP